MAIAASAPPITGNARSSALRRLQRTDVIFHNLTFACAILVLVLLGAVAISLFLGAWPAIRAFGFSFLTSQSWNPVTEKFGGLAPIYGTIVTSIIAMAIAVPIGLGIAIFLTETCPKILRRPIGTAIELLAGIPSIIYGIWGLFVLAPLLQTTVQPALIATFSNIPILSEIFAGPPYGIGVLTASLILAIMVLPFITAISRDVFETVPPMLKEFSLRHRLHNFRSRPQRRYSAYACRPRRRHYAWSGACSWRDDGSDLCHRQCS